MSSRQFDSNTNAKGGLGMVLSYSISRVQLLKSDTTYLFIAIFLFQRPKLSFFIHSYTPRYTLPTVVTRL